MPIEITTPITREEVKKLKAGDRVLISGTVYTARDAAHKRLIENIADGAELPVDIKDIAIYYAGPAPAKPGQVIGSRMDAYAPTLIKRGQTVMIGKGERSQEVINAMKAHGAVYLGAIGGAGALIAKSIISAEIVAYDDLGTEAIRKLTVKDFPAIVVIDADGNNLYER